MNFKPILFLIVFLSSAFSVFAQERSRDFNSSDDYIGIPHQDFTDVTEFTVEAWVNADRFTLTSHNIIREDATGEPAVYLLAVKGGGTNVTFGVNTVNGYIELEVPIVASDFLEKWNHIAGVYNGKEVILYINGDSMSAIPQSGGMEGKDVLVHRIGEKANSENFDGKIDEVRIWKTVRSKEEISAYKDCTLKGPESGLLAVYNMNDTSSTECPDASGNGYHGWVVEVGNGTSQITKICGLSGIADVASIQVAIYPNPASNVIHIRSDELVLDRGKFLIYNDLGQVVYAGTVKGEVDINHLRSGVYVAQISGEFGSINKRFIKD